MVSRPISPRLRRTLAAGLVAVAVAAPLAGMAGPDAVPAPDPVAQAPLAVGGVGALDARYAASRAGVLAAERTADAYGDRQRAAALRTMADPARHFLSFDGRDGGRTVEVFGDLAHARRVAVLVPGSDTNLDSYERLRAGAVALEQQAGGDAAHTAVVAWLGYPTPATVSPEVLTDGLADRAAPQLDAFVGQLHQLLPQARTSLVCHSYGSVVCARAAGGLAAADIVLYGSPGVGGDAGTVAGLHTRAAVWAGRGAKDWIADVPHVRVPLLFTTVGLGADPTAPGFGAHLFPAGDADHSTYLQPGSLSLRSIAAIVTGAADAADAAT
ncbi:alpha/beta hydrolase [Streptacidiphilus rugosus]|uniref:alpha/beta hydrolase n=1 Tax=Streptacidiphilus rugosus TaxID=405783 RepID=UPI0005611A64|nr:alpha/beta hydrolase [Streptacidiphilus rugosus]